RFSALLLSGMKDEAASVLQARQDSFWVRDPRRAAEWKLASCCLDFLGRLQAVTAEMADNMGSPLGEWALFYANKFAPVDSLYRQAEGVADELAPVDPPLDAVLARARELYREAVDKLARLFQTAAQSEGWPASGLPRAGQVYDQHIQPAWQSGQKVA